MVSTGPPLVAVPDLTSFSNCHDAVRPWPASHLVGVCPPGGRPYSSTVPAGAIVGTSPAAHAPYGSTVTVITSKGHAPVAVPAVAGPGTTYTYGRRRPDGGRLRARRGEGLLLDRPGRPGHRHGARPSAGPAPFGSQVTVKVSLGPKPVAVPPLVG